MVRHDAVRKKCDVETLKRRSEDLLERRIVRRIVEKSSTFRGAVDDVEDDAGRADAATTRHVAVHRNTNARSS